MKKKISILLFFLVLVFIVHSCTDDFYDNSGSNESLESKIMLTEAKAWYERINKSPVSVLKITPGGGTDCPVKPDWKHFFASKDKEYEVVEIELLTKHRLSIMDEVTGEKYRTTKNSRYKKSSLRLVYRRNRETGEVFGFYMNIVPEAKYLESTGFNYTKKMNYLERDTTFCGRVMYYDAQGSFINGWRYQKGKVVASLSPVSKEIGAYLKAQLTTRGGEDVDCTLYTTWEIYDVYKEWYANGEYSWDQFLYSEYYYDYWYECVDSGDGDVGNGSGSGNPSNGNTSISATISLDSEGKRKLEQIMEEKRQECGYAAMYNYLTYNNYKMNDIRINSSLSSSGRYNPQTNVMEFKSNDLIESAFSEEFIHFFQNMYYPGGTGQYAKKEGASNIEFEAKLLQDILCRLNGGLCAQLGTNGDSETPYAEWLEAISHDGTQMPSFEDLLVPYGDNSMNYWDFMEDFTHGSPSYDYSIDRFLEPHAFKYIYDNRCN